MEVFRHLSIDVEAGLHGIGIEAAVPISHHLVIKGGYNRAPDIDFFRTDISLNTAFLKEAQEKYELESAAAGENYRFSNRFNDESLVNAGVRLGQNNYKLMLNWYPFAGGKFYFAGGIYYSQSHEREDLLKVEGNTTEGDWASLLELREKTGEDYDMSVKIDDEYYYLLEDQSGRGLLTSSLRIDPLKYYAGMGLGRCIPNRFLGLQIEVGAMFFRNTEVFCQNRFVGSLSEVIDGSLGGDVKDFAEYLNKYPVYPQMTMRLCFRLL